MVAAVGGGGHGTAEPGAAPVSEFEVELEVPEGPPPAPSEPSWRLAPGLDAAHIPKALQEALGLDDLSGMAAHHLVGSDDEALDPRTTHITIQRATMRCGACGGSFRVPPLDLKVRGVRDASSSAYLECPHCRSSIRVTAIDDPNVPQPTAHWITAAQLTKNGDAAGSGRPDLEAREIDVTDEAAPGVERVRPRRESILAVPGRARRIGGALAVASCIIAGVVLSMMAGAREEMGLLVFGATLLVAAVVLAIVLLVRSAFRRAITVATIVGLGLLVLGVLVPATAAVMRCRLPGPGADLSACDLRGADLSRRDLSGADLSDAVLTNANLTDALLAGASFSDARLDGADLAGADLDSADLAGTDLSGISMAGVAAGDADLGGARLSDADLSEADLSGADLAGAELGSADLADATLEGADLSGADLNGAALGGADLTGIEGGSLIASGASLEGADLTGAVLGGADLRSAAAAGAVLADADLSRAELADLSAPDADLSGSDLTSATLRGADLTGADLTGARLSDTNLRNVAGLTDAMLAAALQVPVGRLVDAVVRADLRFETPDEIARVVSKATRGRGVGGTRAYRAGPGFHPIVAAAGAPDLAAWLGRQNAVWVSPGLRFTELVATGSRGEREIETCFYTVHPVTRHQSTLEVDVYAVKTGRLVAQRTFLGSPARACQLTEFVSTYELHGGDVDYNAAFTFLRGLVNPMKGAN